SIVARAAVPSSCARNIAACAVSGSLWKMSCSTPTTKSIGVNGSLWEITRTEPSLGGAATTVGGEACGPVSCGLSLLAAGFRAAERARLLEQHPAATDARGPELCGHEACQRLAMGGRGIGRGAKLEPVPLARIQSGLAIASAELEMLHRRSS